MKKCKATVLSLEEVLGQVVLTIKKEGLHELCQALKNDGSLCFRYLSDITCIDHFPQRPRFEIVIQLYSIEKNWRLRLKVPLKEGEEMLSLCPLWSGANWLEREVYDMFGIPFSGHPDLKRILMPDEWEGYPLRKDFPLQGTKERLIP